MEVLDSERLSTALKLGTTLTRGSTARPPDCCTADGLAGVCSPKCARPTVHPCLRLPGGGGRARGRGKGEGRGGRGEERMRTGIGSLFLKGFTVPAATSANQALTFSLVHLLFQMKDKNKLEVSTISAKKLSESELQRKGCTIKWCTTTAKEQ